MSQAFRSITFVFCICVSLLTFEKSVAKSCESCRNGQFKELESLVPVLEIVGSPRFTPEDFPENKGKSQKEIDRMFGATGTVVCDGVEIASANIVGRRDVLVTAAHVLWDEKCEARKNCEFKTSYDGRPVVRKISSGVNRPQCPQPIDFDKDWEVAILDNPIPDEIDPYPIGDSKSMKNKQSVLAVNGANADFFKVQSNGKTQKTADGYNVMAKSVSRCQWRDRVGSVDLGLTLAACSAAAYSSGSALLNAKGKIVAIYLGSTETSEQLDKALNTKKLFVPNRCNYKAGECHSLYKAIDGDLLEAIQKAASEVST